MKTKAIIVLSVFALLTACSGGGDKKPDAQKQGQQETETAFAQQSVAVPYPASQLRNSLERANLRDRLVRLNDPKKIGYVYIINFGNIVGFYSIRGKVSNTDSQMTTDMLAKRCGQACAYTVTAPGDDGSYGPNESGNFFFTTEGVLVETDLQYLYSDQPLPIDVPRLNSKK